VKIRSETVALALFVASTAALSFGYGIAVDRYRVFPFKVLQAAREGYDELRGRTGGETVYFRRVPDANRAPIRRLAEAQDGVNLVVRIAQGPELSILIADMLGRPIHEWTIDWFTIWPDATHIPRKITPRSRPGTHVDGTVVMPNGDIVFNFEHLGLVRLDPAGKVVWRLAYQTHHSIHLDDNGHLWVSGEKNHTERDPRFPHRVPPFAEYMLLEVSPDGKLLREWSVDDLLVENGWGGMLHLGSLKNTALEVSGDILHLNDVEPFPSTMTPGFFGPGDVLVSLRNVNTVFVFNADTRKIKFVTTGRFTRQHDPDFVDGNRFSVFDNMGVQPAAKDRQSRIVIVTAPEQSVEVYYEGTPAHPFYTDIMGRHQWLPNGNLLITETRRGRAFEINRQGEIVWEYLNPAGNGIVGILEEVARLPVEYGRLYGRQPGT
jgi:hypothetical protein